MSFFTSSCSVLRGVHGGTAWLCPADTTTPTALALSETKGKRGTSYCFTKTSFTPPSPPPPPMHNHFTCIMYTHTLTHSHTHKHMHTHTHTQVQPFPLLPSVCKRTAQILKVSISFDTACQGLTRGQPHPSTKPTSREQPVVAVFIIVLLPPFLQLYGLYTAGEGETVELSSLAKVVGGDEESLSPDRFKE